MYAGCMADDETDRPSDSLPPGAVPVPWETNFRTQMEELRRSAQITQTDLAKRLRDQGLSFHQQTIQKIEAGDRPVRLNEAHLIARALGTSVDLMTRGVADWVASVQREAQEVDDAYKAIVGATYDLATSVSFLETTLKMAAGSAQATAVDSLTFRHQLTRTPWEAVQEGLAKVLAEMASEDVLQRYQPESDKLERLMEMWEEAKRVDGVLSDDRSGAED